MITLSHPPRYAQVIMHAAEHVSAPLLLQVFAPLAKLLGVYCIKEELEELSLQYVEPELYNHIKRWQDKQAKEQQPSIDAGGLLSYVGLGMGNYAYGPLPCRSPSVTSVCALFKQGCPTPTCLCSVPHLRRCSSATGTCRAIHNLQGNLRPARPIPNPQHSLTGILSSQHTHAS